MEGSAESVEKCECIVCDKPLKNLMDGCFQPLGGTAFQSYGHYGSTFFDPMDGSYIEIVVCDECLNETFDSIGRTLPPKT